MKVRLQLWKSSVPDETNMPNLRNYLYCYFSMVFMQKLKCIALLTSLSVSIFTLLDTLNADAEQGYEF